MQALLLQTFQFRYVRSGQLVEQLEYNLLFRWFVGLGMNDAVWNHAVFAKNRDRLLNADVARQFFAEVSRLVKRFMSDEHLTVNGTLIQVWASQRSFRPKDEEIYSALPLCLPRRCVMEDLPRFHHLLPSRRLNEALSNGSIDDIVLSL